MLDAVVRIPSMMHGFLGGLDSKKKKNLPAMQETLVQLLGWEDPLEREWPTTPTFLPGESTDREAWWATVCGVSKSQT